MMMPQDGSKVLRHFNTYDKLGNNDGSLGIFELTTALWDYVEAPPPTTRRRSVTCPHCLFTGIRPHSPPRNRFEPQAE